MKKREGTEESRDLLQVTQPINCREGASVILSDSRIGDIGHCCVSPEVEITGWPTAPFLSLFPMNRTSKFQLSTLPASIDYIFQSPFQRLGCVIKFWSVNCSYMWKLPRSALKRGGHVHPLPFLLFDAWDCDLTAVAPAIRHLRLWNDRGQSHTRWKEGTWIPDNIGVIPAACSVSQRETLICFSHHYFGYEDNPN